MQARHSGNAPNTNLFYLQIAGALSGIRAQ